MRVLAACLLVGAFTGGCSAFAPSVSEDDGVGSNTNWFRACDGDGECDADLACICGTCSKACSSDDECGDGSCPVDRGAFLAQCGPRAALEASEGTCFQSCEDDTDCPGGRVCVAGGCAAINSDPCASASSISFESPTPQLRARVGALYGDEFYLPQWYPTYPQNWVEPTQPAELVARVLDEEGQPVAGCEVQFISEESSGYGYAADPLTDDAGEVRALWVAGTDPEQRLRAAVRAGSGIIFAELEGQARRHDEEPSTMGPQAVSYTAPSGLVVNPAQSDEATQIRVGFTPLTFPPGITYIPLETNRLAIEFTNASSDDPEQVAVASGERLLTFRIPDQEGESGSVIAILRSAYCVYESLGVGLICQYSDAWEPGETIQVRVEALDVAVGEAPIGYDLATHSQEPCYSLSGCTDFSIFVKRAGADWLRMAVLRAVGAESFADRSILISGVYTPEIGIASTCLETSRAAFITSHELSNGGDWQWSDGGSSWAFYDTWQNQTCANYAAFNTPEGFYLSTGGPSPISTPSLPGTSREL